MEGFRYRCAPRGQPSGLHAERASLERHHVTDLQLSTASPVGLAVDLDVSIDDGFLDIAAGVEDPGELHERAEADALGPDEDVLGCGGAHPSRMTVEGTLGITRFPLLELHASRGQGTAAARR